MKTLNKNINWRSTAGYTIDQTILVVAVIALLITLVIGSVGWDILNRASATKLASQLRQIEDANGHFFAQHNSWPHQMVTAGTPEQKAVEVLVRYTAANTTIAAAADHRSYLPALKLNGNIVQHDFGGNANRNITMAVNGAECDTAAGSTLVLSLGNVPEGELNEADENMDGEDGRAAGRLRWSVPAGGVADATYCANTIN